MNNFESIKSMNIYEMASFIENVSYKKLCDFCANKGCMHNSCADGIIKWLESESEQWQA